MSRLISQDRAVEERLDALAALVAERHLLERLVAAGDALAAADDGSRVADVLVEHLLDAFGAPVAALFVRDGDRLRAEAMGGVSAPVRDAWADLPASGVGLPIVEAMERGETVVAVTQDELLERFPAVATLAARTGLPGASAFVPMIAADRPVGVLLLRFAEARQFTEGELGFLRSFAHQGALALARAQALQIARGAIAEARQAADRADFLARTAATLGRSLDDRSTLQEVADLAVPAIADWCFVNVIDESGHVIDVASAFANPQKAWLAELAPRYAPDRDAGASTTYVLDTLRPLLIEQVTDEQLTGDARDAEHLAFLRAFEARSAIVVPLISHERAFGSLTFLTAESGRRYVSEDLTLAVEIARRAAAAIENDRLYADLRRARERAESLARASDLLAQGTDRETLLRRLADLAVVTFADWCFVNLPDASGTLRCAVATARSAEDRRIAEQSLGRVIVDPAFTEGRSILWERLDDGILASLAEGDAAAPLDVLRALSPGSALAVPIRGRGRVLGSLSLIVRAGHKPYGAADIDHAEQLAWRTALAIENTALYDELRRGRAHAELIAEASELMGGSDDLDTILRAVARLAVPRFADWCFVNLRDDDGAMRNVAVEYADPAWADLAARSLQEPVRGSDWLDEGDATLIPRVDDDTLIRLAAGDQGHLAFLRAFRADSYIAAPIRGRSGTVGSLAFLIAGSGRRFDASDAALAADLARRAAAAIDTARLHQDLRRLAVVEQARASELEAVIQAVGDPMVVCDRDGRVRLANQAATIAFDGDVPATFAAIRARFEEPVEFDGLTESGHRGPVELRLRGTDRWLELTMYPVATSYGASDDGPELLVGSSILLLRDVTAIRRALELREAFIGVLSHELRTPITTIYGGTRVLARDGVSEETRREIAADVTAEAERLHRLVEDLLVLARAERETMDLGGDPVLLQHLVPRVLRTEEQRWPEATFTLTVPATVGAVSGDETYVEQVVRNLVGNAAKYGAGNGQVEVVVEPYEDEVVVRVLDEGPGFTIDESERLFELFYRAAQTSATTSGAGIGLFVCRALVEAMGGRIWAHPRPAGGAEFGFALPLFAEDD